jgi:hypothetical protein
MGSEYALTKTQFECVGRKVSCGLGVAELNLLYGYLCDTERGVLPAMRLLRSIRQRLPTIPSTELGVALSKIRKAIVVSPHSLNTLYSRLSLFGVERIPFLDFVECFRLSGVAMALVPDIMLEYLRLAAPTCVQAVSLVRGPMPQARVALLRKLFNELQASQGDSIPKSLVVDAFNPDPHAALFRCPQRWRQCLLDYLSTLDGHELEFDQFAFYWLNVAAGITEDSTFGLMLWKGFSMHRLGSARSAASARDGRHVSPTPSRSGYSVGTPARLVGMDRESTYGSVCTASPSRSTAGVRGMLR